MLSVCKCFHIQLKGARQGRMWVEYMEIFFFASHYQKNSEAKTYPETKYLLFLKLHMCLCICFGCEGNMGFVLLDNIKTL